jgi:hypothetical protein
MASWDEFDAAAPEMAQFGRDLFDRVGAAFLSTVRSDGSPRLHPVVPIICEGMLFVFCGGPKVGDLLRDGRYVLHALIDKDDNEFFVAGRAKLVNHDRALRSSVARAAPYEVPENAMHQLFRFDVMQAHVTIWYHPGHPDTRPMHKDWKAS